MAADLHESQLKLDKQLGKRLRVQARALGVSVASLFHLAMAHMLARI